MPWRANSVQNFKTWTSPPKTPLQRFTRRLVNSSGSSSLQIASAPLLQSSASMKRHTKEAIDRAKGKG